MNTRSVWIVKSTLTKRRSVIVVMFGVAAVVLATIVPRAVGDSTLQRPLSKEFSEPEVPALAGVQGGMVADPQGRRVCRLRRHHRGPQALRPGHSPN
jgi:hypothetical protein